MLLCCGIMTLPFLITVCSPVTTRLIRLGSIMLGFRSVQVWACNVGFANENKLRHKRCQGDFFCNWSSGKSFVQEMIGLCLFVLDQSRREAEMCLDTAYNYYQVKIDQSFMTILFLPSDSLSLLQGFLLHREHSSVRKAACYGKR